jgi:hypothetical protein
MRQAYRQAVQFRRRPSGRLDGLPGQAKSAATGEKANKGKLLREAVGDDNFVNPVLAAYRANSSNGRYRAERLSQ